MLHEEVVAEIVVVTYAIAEAVQQSELDDLERLLHRRADLVTQVNEQLSEAQSSQIRLSERKAFSAITHQKVEIAKEISRLFSEQRMRKAYQGVCAA